MSNIFEKELKKHEERNNDVCEMLDNYEKNGISNDEVELFNILCKEEVELKFRIESLKALSEGRPSKIDLSPISRKIKIIVSAPKMAINDASIIKNINE